MLKNGKDIAEFIQQSDFMMESLKVAESAGLPDWFIGAGFIRDTVWDIQHGFTLKYKYKDLDLGYYDKDNQSERADNSISEKLRRKLNVNWEVVNQAYAHKYNDVPPYTSAVDGLAHWVETATCVAATLDKHGKVKVIAPWGVEDLLELKLRLAPCHKDSTQYEKIFTERIVSKDWLKRWPKLKVL